jgi:hypothetical protein
MKIRLDISDNVFLVHEIEFSCEITTYQYLSVTLIKIKKSQKSRHHFKAFASYTLVMGNLQFAEYEDSITNMNTQK